MNRRLSLFEKMGVFCRWDFYSGFILFAVLVCQASNWLAFPLFIDCYYHLCVVRGFSDAGGWVGEAFWEYAPFGRPHLYPPLFHLLELFLFKCGMGLMTIARFFDFLIYPLFLGAVWQIVRIMDSRRLAFLSLCLLCSSFPFFVSAISNIPFCLAFIFGLLSFFCMRKLKIAGASLSLVLCFYTHSLMPWLFVIAFFLYAFVERGSAKVIFYVCLSAIILASPLLWHALIYSHFILPVRTMEFYYADLNPALYLLSLTGIFLCFKEKRRSLYFFMILIMAMAVLLFTHRDRFFSGVGLIPASVMAAYTLDTVWLFLKKHKSKIWRIVFFAALGFLFYGATPIVSFSPFEHKVILRIDSAFLNRWRMNEAPTVKADTIYYAKFVDELVRLMRLSSSIDDIFFFNYSYGGGMFSALSHRASSTAMLAEVGPFYTFDPILYARFIFLFKDPQDIYYKFLPVLIDRYKLTRVAETEVACLYTHDCWAKRKVIKAVVSLKVCFLLLFLACVVIVADIFSLLPKRKHCY